MLHTKCQGHQSSGSRKYFKGLLPYMGTASILDMLSLLLFCHFSVDATYLATVDWDVTGIQNII